MDRLKEYFDRVAYRAKYLPGDRVCGRWNGIPFRGIVAFDRKLSQYSPPMVTVFTHLPIKWGDKYYHTIEVDHENIGSLT